MQNSRFLCSIKIHDEKDRSFFIISDVPFTSNLGRWKRYELKLSSFLSDFAEPETTKKATVLQQVLPPRAPVIASGNGGAIATGGTAGLFASLFSDHAAAAPPHSTGQSSEPISLGLSHGFSTAIDRRALGPPSPHMSATALLQKAAQLGASSSNNSLLRGFGLSTSSTPQQWWDHHNHHHHEQHPEEVMGTALVAGPPPFFVGKPTTLDLLGLGRDGSPAGGLSALITSIGGALERTASASEPPKPWDSSALFSSSRS